MSLRDSAAGKPCLIRIPGICCGDDTRTVLCHVRMIDISAMALKAPDILAAFGCDACHDVVDNRTHLYQFSATQRRLWLLEGMARTLIYRLDRGELISAA